jgi:hypothetical protein
LYSNTVKVGSRNPSHVWLILFRVILLTQLKCVYEEQVIYINIFTGSTHYITKFVTCKVVRIVMWRDGQFRIHIQFATHADLRYQRFTSRLCVMMSVVCVANGWVTKPRGAEGEVERG